MANFGRRQIFPICPLVKEVVNKDTFPNIPNLPKTSRRLDSIWRILEVFRELIARQKPTKEFITWCAHRDNVLQDCMNLVDKDLKLLPKRYEKDYPDTSKELKKLIKRLYANVLMYQAAHNYPLFMLPPIPDKSLKDFRDVLAWQNEKENLDMAGCLFLATKQVSETTKQICHYPASAIETMNKISNELLSVAQIDVEKDKEEKAKLLYKELVESKAGPKMILNGELIYLRRLESSLALMLKKNELSSPASVRQSKTSIYHFPTFHNFTC